MYLFHVYIHVSVHGKAHSVTVLQGRAVGGKRLLCFLTSLLWYCASIAEQRWQ